MENNKQQTAVDWLVEHLLPKVLTDEQYYHIMKAKHMEKKQIIDSFGVGCQVELKRLIGYHGMAQQYYNDTYENRNTP
jgi:hypothetical protein